MYEGQTLREAQSQAPPQPENRAVCGGCQTPQIGNEIQVGLVMLTQRGYQMPLWTADAELGATPAPVAPPPPTPARQRKPDGGGGQLHHQHSAAARLPAPAPASALPCFRCGQANPLAAGISGRDGICFACGHPAGRRRTAVSGLSAAAGTMPRQRYPRLPGSR